ncbi:transketolase [Aciditerrimonas ferrireducens]|uniref:Transketolase n=1 Tax=Aciditerrimonas ferrireducens TaxID=667306 RepID=A0ABV6C2B4_9ACTN
MSEPAATPAERPRPASHQNLDELAVNVIRGIAMDGPQRANSGHPGTAMALAPLAHVLFSRILRYDPADPSWPDRDRFVLSCGHASILLYTMLHLAGYDLSLEDLKAFRQWGSKTPGHPEVRHTPGVEVTTGPLGQGLGNAVGLALAERFLRSRLGPEVVDHRTFVICSDGDLMEGISHEAASLAGHLGLGRLVAVYDDNHITIDGSTSLAYSDDVPGRFRAYGWHVEELGEMANDLDGLEAALRRAMAVEDRPSLLVLRSHIGWPAPGKTDTAAAHGSPLGEEVVKETKRILGLPPEETFWVPEEVRDLYRGVAARGAAAREAWCSRLSSWRGDRQVWEAHWSGQPLPGFAEALPRFEPGASLATRRAIKACVDATAPMLPGLLAGSADLTENTGVELADAETQSAATPGGRQVHYGIREHAMGAVMNGLALHGGILPVGGTFFVFSDYLRPTLRLAAMSRAKVVHFFTHDSIGLGEDGPTHQPVEHLASLRAIPGLQVVRPADANETAQAWRLAVHSPGPTALVLSRQALPVLPGTLGAPVERGAYVLQDPKDSPPVLVLIGTGSEVQLCLRAAELLASAEPSLAVRVVSMPSWDRFAAQEPAYQAEVLPPELPRLAVEAASPFGWERYADDVLGLDRFGASAPGEVVMARLGFTAEAVAERAQALWARWQEHGGSPSRRTR